MCVRRNMNEDEFLYDVSEESILKDWNMGTEAPDHEFSEKYKEFRQELIYRAEKGRSGNGFSKRRSAWRPPLPL